MTFKVSANLELLAPDEEMPNKFMIDFIESLKEGDAKKVVELIENDIPEDLIKECSWQIVPAVSSHLTLHNVTYNQEIYEACKRVLNVVIEKCNPSETILELLEQVECSDDDTKFLTILELLSKSLRKSDDKTKVIEWCIGTIRSYIEDLPVPVPEDTKLTESEVLSKELDDKIHRVISIYNSVVSFLEPLIKEASLLHTDFKNHKIFRDCLINFLISLLGKPLCCILPYRNSSITVLFEIIASYLCQLMGDPLALINVIDNRINQENSAILKKGRNDSDLLNKSSKKKQDIPSISVANFYFFVVTTKSLWTRVPQVYHPHYLLQSSLYLIKYFLEEPNNALTDRGLNFMENVLLRVEKHSVGADVLQLSIYAELFDNIVKVMIFCNRDTDRKVALNIFHKYLDVFDLEARYLILLHLYETGDHSGFLSLLAGVAKACIIECIESNQSCPHFRGNSLRVLLNYACRLPHGANSDLVEISDEIVAALNLLRFLTIRDLDNTTGIWDIMDDLYSEYLLPLRKGIDLCKGHWITKMRDLEEYGKTHGKAKKWELEKDITITVGIEQLPAMPLPEKIEFCRRALISLDMMESILVRVNECIAAHSLR